MWSPPAEPSAESPLANAPPTCPSIIGVGVQVVEALQVFCVDDGGSWHPLHQWPQWTDWAAHSQSIFFSDDREKGKDAELVGVKYTDGSKPKYFSKTMSSPLQRYTRALDIIIPPLLKNMKSTNTSSKEVLLLFAVLDARC